MAFTIRPAIKSDITHINAINDHYIANTVLTFALTPPSEAEAIQKYQLIKNSGLPYIIALDSNINTNQILGYIYATPYRGDRGGYARTVELSLFCHPEHLGKGIGSALLARFLEILREPERFGEQWLGKHRLEEEKRVQQVLAIMALDEMS